MPSELTPASPLRLHDLVGERAHALVDDWCEAVRAASPAIELDPTAREGISSFLTELKTALKRAVAEGPPPSPRKRKADDAERTDPEGELDPAAATHAYGRLHSSILEAAAERGLDVSLVEQSTLALHVNEAIARAVTAYLRAQHHELHRVAHELRNPLGSAMMALTLLRSRADLGEHARLAEMVERNLRRLEEGIDGALARGRRFEPLPAVDPEP